MDVLKLLLYDSVELLDLCIGPLLPGHLLGFKPLLHVLDFILLILQSPLELFDLDFPCLNLVLATFNLSFALDFLSDDRMLLLAHLIESHLHPFLQEFDLLPQTIDLVIFSFQKHLQFNHLIVLPATRVLNVIDHVTLGVFQLVLELLVELLTLQELFVQ